jgi:hypothetical protein
MKGATKGWVGLAILVLVAGPTARAAEDPEPAVVEEILGVLSERGLIDSGEHDRLVARYHEQEAAAKKGLPRLQFYGDLRLRGEGFVYDEDPVAGHTPNRYRGRYRLRLGFDAGVTDYAIVHFRLASSEDDSRSNNISFGFKPDWGPGPIWIDRASLELKAPSRILPVENGRASLEAGRMANPFVWKQTRDVMLWDNDISPEGVAVRLGTEVASGVDVFFNGGYLIDDENSTSRDPHLIGTQLGATWEASPEWSLGARTTWYGFRSIDSNFICRGATGQNCNGSSGSTQGGGNIPDGLTGSPNGGTINVGELAAYATWRGLEGWPVTVWGDVAKNFSAESSEVFGDGSQPLAYMAGLQVGDRTNVVELGFSWLWVEANAFPSQFVESDWIDGMTNHRAAVFWVTRRIFPNTDLQALVSLQDAIEDDLPEFEDSVGRSDRVRFQTDLVIGF